MVESHFLLGRCWKMVVWSSFGRQKGIFADRQRECVWSARRETTGVPLLNCVCFVLVRGSGWRCLSTTHTYTIHTEAHLMQLSFVLWEELRCMHGCVCVVQWLLICTQDYLCTLFVVERKIHDSDHLWLLSHGSENFSDQSFILYVLAILISLSR